MQQASAVSAKSIHLKTAIPGPKSQAMLDRRALATPTGLAKSTQVVIDYAEGAVVHDVDGNTLLDFAGGIGMMNAGHRPPGVVEALKAQADKYIHLCALVGTYEPYVALAEKLVEITPGNFPKKALLSCSGSEAVENAVKVARSYTGRQGVLVFEGGYHGRTNLTLSMTSKYALFKKGFGPFAPEVYRIPAPNVYRRPLGMTVEAYEQWCIDQLDHAMIAQVDPSALAAIVIEPVQGEAGFIPMPKSFLQKIRVLCDTHGIVMVADEIQSGFGRTGKLFAIEHYGIVPDVITMAKSMAAGMPISATVGRAEIMDSTHLGGVGGTYGGSPMACVAALETIEVINQPAFMARAEEIGQKIQATLEGWQQKYFHVGDARGLGAMRLVEFVEDHERKRPVPDFTLNVIKRAVSNGVILIRAGLYSNCIRLLPPLVITNEQLEEGLQVLEEAIAAHH